MSAHEWPFWLAAGLAGAMYAWTLSRLYRRYGWTASACPLEAAGYGLIVLAIGLLTAPPTGQAAGLLARLALCALAPSPLLALWRAWRQRQNGILRGWWLG